MPERDGAPMAVQVRAVREREVRLLQHHGGHGSGDLLLETGAIVRGTRRKFDDYHRIHTFGCQPRRQLPLNVASRRQSHPPRGVLEAPAAVEALAIGPIGEWLRLTLGYKNGSAVRIVEVW